MKRIDLIRHQSLNHRAARYRFRSLSRAHEKLHFQGRYAGDRLKIGFEGREFGAMMDGDS